MMVRTQIQLTEEQMLRLKRAAADEGLSIAEMVRRLVDMHLGATERQRRLKDALAASRSLRFGSGLGDVSKRHDEYYADGLYEELQEKRR